MARYELAKAKEFWEIALYGRKLTVIQGKIGSGGQSSTKAFRSERDAAMKHDDLVAEKEKQGYRHVAKVAKSLAPAMNVPSIRRHLAAGEVAVVAGQLHPAKKRDQKLWLALEPAERRALLLADDELTNEVYDLAREIETGARREESLILFDDLVVIKSWVAKEASDYGLRALLGCKKDPSFTADRARSYLSVGIRQWPKFTGLHETAAATAAELCKRGHALEEFADKVVRSNRGFTAALRKLGRLDAGTPTPRAALKRALHEDRDRFMLLGGSVVMKHLIEVIDELPDTVEAVYQKLLDEMTGAVNFGLLLAMAAALPRGEPTLLPKFKSTSASVRLYRGDLHIRGDLSFSQDLVVMGDLVVDGVIEDSSEFLYLLVSGSVRARAIHCGHKLWSGGKVEAEVIALTRRAVLYAEKGAKASLVVANTSELKVLSKVRAKTYVDGETMHRDPEDAMRKLQAILAPKCFKGSTGDYFEPGPLIDLVRKRGAWTR